MNTTQICKIPDNVTAVILAGTQDFGRCQLASQLPVALWPVFDRPVIERLLHNLWRQGVKKTVICPNTNAAVIKNNISKPELMDVEYLEEEFPAGTAGCIRDAARDNADNLLLVISGTTTSVPNIATLLQAHRASGAAFTVVFEKEVVQCGGQLRPAQMYVCEPSVVEHIPESGYCDIKEGLLPILVGKNVAVGKVILENSVRSFRDRSGYLVAISDLLKNGNFADAGFKQEKEGSLKNVRIHESAQIHPDARIFGDVVLMPGASVDEKAVIFGPAVISRDAVIGPGALVENSILWARSRIEDDCRVRRSIVGYDTKVPEQAFVENRSFFNGGKNRQKKLSIGNISAPRRNRNKILLAVSVLMGLFLWLYLPEFKALLRIWLKSDEYSSGLLVPFLAGYVLWTRRSEIAATPLRPSLWGLAAFVAVQALRYFGIFFMYASAQRLSIVLSIASLVLLVLGRQMLRKLSTVLIFLCLMLPLPKSVHYSVLLPLQNFAVSAAVFLLETLGFAVIQEGNIIHIDNTSIAVAEACNGLRMMTAFFVVTGLIVLLVKKPWWEKLIVLVSSLSVALLCNAIRLTVTAVILRFPSAQGWEGGFHDFGGYAMIPLAIGIVIGEFRLFAGLKKADGRTVKKIIVRREADEFYQPI